MIFAMICKSEEETLKIMPH